MYLLLVLFFSFSIFFSVSHHLFGRVGRSFRTFHTSPAFYQIQILSYEKCKIIMAMVAIRLAMDEMQEDLYTPPQHRMVPSLDCSSPPPRIDDSTFHIAAGIGGTKVEHAQDFLFSRKQLFFRTGNSCCFKGGGTGRVRPQRLTAGEEPGPLPGGGARRVSLSQLAFGARAWKPVGVAAARTIGQNGGRHVALRGGEWTRLSCPALRRARVWRRRPVPPPCDFPGRTRRGTGRQADTAPGPCRPAAPLCSLTHFRKLWEVRAGVGEH